MHRATFPEVPPRVEYALTEKGLALVPIIDSMRTYGAEWLGASGSCAEAPEPSPRSSPKTSLRASLRDASRRASVAIRPSC